MFTTAFWQDNHWQDFALRLLLLAIIWLVVWFVVRYIGRWVLRLILRSRGFTDDDGGFTLLRRTLRALVIITGILSSLAILGLTPLLASTLTTIGIVGIMVGLAVKDVAANFVSGVLLLFDRPFSLGDFVSAGNVQGNVEIISLRSTRIRTPEGPVVTIPNSVIASNAITNYSLSRARRVELTWKLPMDADIDAASRVLVELATADARVVAAPPPAVTIGDVRDDSFDLRLVTYVQSEDWQAAQSDLKRALVTRLAQQSNAANDST
jgi:small conductance mechanosensitive channel